MGVETPSSWLDLPQVRSILKLVGIEDPDLETAFAGLLIAVIVIGIPSVVIYLRNRSRAASGPLKSFHHGHS